MGIFDGILGGQGGLTTTTTNTTTPHSGGAQNAVWTTTAIGNPHMQQINNPSTWNTMSPFEVLGEQIKELRYILQRTVENYDELQAQYKALQDIAKAGENNG